MLTSSTARPIFSKIQTLALVYIDNGTPRKCSKSLYSGCYKINALTYASASSLVLTFVMQEWRQTVWSNIGIQGKTPGMRSTFL